MRSQISDRAADILATTGVHIGGTDFDRLLDLSTVMPLLGYRHIGTGGHPGAQQRVLRPDHLAFDPPGLHP